MAAGLGFKTFTTGEVLTAADVNGYLMQGVLVFASAAARDAAITSPQEGQCCYLKDTDAVLTYSGTAWVGFDDSNAIQNAIVDAKGDLIAASAADTPARLAVGSNGDTLLADSSQTTGLRYNPPVGSLANYVINGGMDIWQRGTSVAMSASTNGYTVDRWSLRAPASAACTVSRQTTSDTTNLPNIQYCCRVQRNSGQTGTGAIDFFQFFETANTIPLVGKTVTLSFYAKAGANFSAASSILTGSIYYGTGTDQNLYGTYTGATAITTNSAILTTTWQRFAYTFTVNTAATEIAIGWSYSGVGTASTNDWYEITGVQLDIGTYTASTAPTFRRSGGTLAGELAACQRYYMRFSASGAYTQLGQGIGNTTTNGEMGIALPIQMRVAPTAIDYSTIRLYDTIADHNVTAVSLIYASPNYAHFNATTTGLTVYRPYYLFGWNSTSAYIGFSAEL